MAKTCCCGIEFNVNKKPEGIVFQSWIRGFEPEYYCTKGFGCKVGKVSKMNKKISK